jgi:hypothetical protein
MFMQHGSYKVNIAQMDHGDHVIPVLVIINTLGAGKMAQ